MPIDVEDISEKAFEHAFAKSLEDILQKKAEELFQKAFANGSPFAKKLEDQIELGFERFVEQGIRWEKKRAGFKKDR